MNSKSILTKTLSLIVSAAILAVFVIPASAASMGVVNTNSLRLRSGPSTSSSILANYDAGTKVVIYDRDQDWYKVYVDGKEGYMSAQYVDVNNKADFEPISATISTEVLNFREKPSTEANILTQLGKGTVISVIGVEEGWFKAKYSDKTGYVHPSYIKLGSSSSASASYDEPSGAVRTEAGSAAAQEVIDFAMSLRGVPYRYGGKSPSGFDCSGFTYYVFNHFGYSLSGGATTQLNYGTKISRSELMPGDLVFFSHPSYPSYPAGHVGIYLGNNEFIHAPSPGKVVRVESMGSGYYNDRYVAARRLIS